MLNYIATEKTAMLIKSICEEKRLLILYEQTGTTNISKYLKETKVNFNLIKYFIIEISCLNNSEDEIIENIYNLSRLNEKIRIIILAQNYDNDSKLLNSLYDNGIYNIVNSIDESIVKQDIIKCLSGEGLQKKDAEKFKKVETIEQKESKIAYIATFIKSIFIKIRNNKIPKNNGKQKKQCISIENEKIKNNNTMIKQSSGIYFFALILEALTRLVKLIGYIAIFFLTSIGITILLNQELRNLVFQMFGLK